MSAPAIADSAALARVAHLELVARRVVDGLQAGQHRSRLKGQSIDFADHRAYAPGDDLRRLDWKVLGRSDRLVLKRYEADTDLACHLIVDGSGSMSYRGSRAAATKFGYVSELAACIAHIAVAQGDRVGAIVAKQNGASELQPLRQSGVQRVLHHLAAEQPEAITDLTSALPTITAPTTGRGLVILLSDLMIEPEAIDPLMTRLMRRGHDLAVVWTLDPDELDLGIDAVSRFQGLESDGELLAEPRALRTAYRSEVERHRQAVLAACHRHRALIIEANSGEAHHLPLNRLLVGLIKDA